MILKRIEYLNLFILLCLSCCTNCSNNIYKHTKQVEQPTGYLMANRDNLLMQGHSSSFVDGYIDGCKSGQSNAGDTLFEYVKDEHRVAIEKDYFTGWEQGNSFCYEHMRDLIKNSDGSPNAYYSQEALEREKQRMWSELRK